MNRFTAGAKPMNWTRAMPVITSTKATIMIGEKGAAMIKESARQGLAA